MNVISDHKNDWPSRMQGFLLVFVGAGFGGVLRHGINLVIARGLPNSIGVGTLLANILGCFLMGALVELFALRAGASQALRLFLATGFLGGFTTFSAFSLDTMLLYERGAVGWATLNVVASVSLSIAALVAGSYLVRHVSG